MTSSSRRNFSQFGTEVHVTYTIQQGKDFGPKAYEFDIRRLTSAADYAADLCMAYSIPFAFMGAYCLKLRGHKRDTSDVDIAFGGNMEQLLHMITGRRRILVPVGQVAGTLRVLVSTGGGVNGYDRLDIKEVYIQVDFYLCGDFGVPNDIREAIEILIIDTPVGKRTWPLFNIRTLMSSKLSAWIEREHDRDFDDIVWLIFSHSAAVYTYRTTLNVTHLQFFINYYIQNITAPGKEWKVKDIRHILGFVGFLVREGETVPCSGTDTTGTRLGLLDDCDEDKAEEDNKKGKNREGKDGKADERNSNLAEDDTPPRW